MSIKKLLLTVTLFSAGFSISPISRSHPFTIVLDPGTGYEPPVLQTSLTYLEAVRQTLEDTFPEIRIVFAHTRQERTDYTQVASFSNRLQVDLHLSFNFTTAKNDSHEIHVYTCGETSYQTTSARHSEGLSFISVSTAYLDKQKESQHCAQLFSVALKSSSVFKVAPPSSLPLKALHGVLAPSFLVELPAHTASLSVICEGCIAAVNHLLTKEGERYA